MAPLTDISRAFGQQASAEPISRTMQYRKVRIVSYFEIFFCIFSKFFGFLMELEIEFFLQVS